MAAEASPQVEPETVEILLDATRRMLDNEGQRGQGLEGRGTAIAGFLGITIALAGSVEASTRGSRGGYHAAASALVGAALIALLVAVGLIGWGVLLPTPTQAVAMEEIERFPTLRFVARDPVMTQGYLLRGAIGVLRRERRRNNHKARWLRYGYLGMGVGLLLVTSAGLVLTIQAIAHG
jgi:hypothetical protein